MVYNVIKHTGEVKMAKEESIHSGHRRRLKESMLKSDFKGISDINLLEAILFYSVSRSDTNETAHKLLESFGSVEKVFEAHFEDLKNVPGIGDNSAFLIKLINETAKKIHSSNPQKAVYIKGPVEASEVFKPFFIGEKDEMMLAMYLDNSSKLIRVDVLGRGVVNSVSFDNRKLLEGAIRTNAASVILSHNHPHGLPIPSREDLNLTGRLRELLSNIGVALSDHLVYAEGEWRCVSERSDAARYITIKKKRVAEE